MSKIEFWRSQDWTMVYEDGQLVKSGDHYLADEWLQAKMGVVVVDDEAGVCIPDGHHAIASLAEVMERVRERHARLDEASDKRAEAKRLLDEAKALEAQK